MVNGKKVYLSSLERENLEQLRSLTEHQWWNDDRPELGSIGVFSKFYCLTDNHSKTVDDLYPDGFKP